MEDLDDRPGSVYDNLNGINIPILTKTMPTTTTILTSTPKAKTNNALRYRYDEIPFRSYDESASANAKNRNNNQQKSQLIGQQQHPLLPNGQSQLQQQQKQKQAESVPLLREQVSGPMHQQRLQTKSTENDTIHSTHLMSQELPPVPTAVSATKTTAAATTNAIIEASSSATTPTMPTATTTTTVNTVALPTVSNSGDVAANASPQRPLSQHSQSELNEASHSIAAVKAALNDAKSKFFGLNGYSQDIKNDTPYLLDPSGSELADSHVAKANILPTNHRQQPKYQNIPENSAIYRKQQEQQLPPETLPPSLPPKTKNEQSKTNALSANSDRLMGTSSPQMSTLSPSTSSSTSSSASSSQSHSPTAEVLSTTKSSIPNNHLASDSLLFKQPPQQLKPHEHHEINQELIPATVYRQLPLNDLDGPQPSQAVYMSTTVPQNIKGSKIAGRHTPTRNSLRHSRMLVVNNKNCQGSHYPNPMNFKYPNLSRWFLVLQTSLAVLLIFLSIGIFFLAPNAAVQDNPYWSGLVLLLTGIIGLVIIRYRRIKRHKVRDNCFIFLRADSYFMSLVALLLCLVAAICASIHFARLTANDTRCVSSNILLEHASCVCTFNAPSIGKNATHQDDWTNAIESESISEEKNDDRRYTVEYRDLSCHEVSGEWICILGASIILNTLGFIITLIYIISLVYCRRANSKRYYSSVYTSTF